MGTNYQVSSDDLDDIVNAINAKTHTSSQLEFPDEFISAIESIEGESTIKFYIQKRANTLAKESFIAAEGMTWGAFIDSKYNPNYSASEKRFKKGTVDPMGEYNPVFYYVNSSGTIASSDLSGQTQNTVIVDGQTYT